MLSTNISDAMDKNSGIGARLLLAATLLSLAYIIIIMDAASLQQSIRSELQAISGALGEEVTTDLVAQVNDWYQVTVYDSGVYGWFQIWAQPSGWNGDQFWREPVVKLGDNLLLTWYQMCVRVNLMMHWGLLALPFIICCIADGWYARRIKQHEFTISSTATFRIAGWIVGTSLMVYSIYLVVPAVGQYGPYLPLGVALCCAIVGRHIISNMAKMA